MILTDGRGVPFSRPEPPGSDASIEEKIAFLRAFSAYSNAIANCANLAFDRAFLDSMRMNEYLYKGSETA